MKKTNIKIQYPEIGIFNKSSRLVLAFLMIFGFCTISRAQDKITLANGTEFKGKIVEITDTEVKYKAQDNLTGPTRGILKSDIFMINYENGTKEVFGNELINAGPVKQIIITQQPPVDRRFDQDSSDFAKTRRKRFAGPRVGFTYIGPGVVADYLNREAKQPLITQFGWQFEGRLFTTENGDQGLIEFVPLIGGLEQGMFIPSANILLGLRGGEKIIYEFAIGPNFSVTRNYNSDVVLQTGIVIALGTSFKRGNIYFPVTVAFVPGIGTKVERDTYDYDTKKLLYEKGQKISSGFKLSLLVGFNYRKK